MSWLLFVFALEAGIVPTISHGGEVLQWHPLVGYTQLECKAQMLNGHLFIGGTVKTYITWSDPYFSPRFVVYDLGIGMRFGLFEAGYRHRCSHDVVPLSPLIEGGYDELYLRVEVER